MRILYLTEFLSAIGGGGEVMLRDFALEMANRGHKVDFVCHQSGDFWEFENDLLTIHKIAPPISLKHGCFPSLFQQLFFILKLVFKGSQIVDKYKIDIIHANTLSPAFAAAILGKLYNIPVINTIHHVYSLKNNEYATEGNRGNAFIFKLFSLPKLICEKAIIRLPADGIHTVSESSKDDLIRFGIKDSAKISIIPNAVDLRHFVDKSDNVQYENFVLFIGRLVKYKNLDVVIDAFRGVVDAIPDARLVIVGDGPAIHEWKELASSNGLSDNIVFEGYVSEERKDELLRNCSILVFPSLIEGFGIVLLEAFAHRKPVIISDVRPLTEIVGDNVDGLVAGATSPDDWAEKIVFLLKNKSRCERMGANGRSKVESGFNIIHAAESLESSYKDLIEKRCGKLEELETTI